MVAFYFRTPARIPGNMQVWVPAIIFCVLSCMKTGYHDDGPEDMVQSPDRSESLYVTGVEYPSGYDWSSGKYGSTTASLLFLMKDGKRILELPAGKGYGVSDDPSRHRCVGGHLYTDCPDGTETVVRMDGTELFRYDGNESIVSFYVKEGIVYTLGILNYGPEGRLAFRENGRVLYETDGCLISPLYDDGEWCFSYSRSGKCNIYYGGEIIEPEIGNGADTVLFAGIYGGRQICVAGSSASGTYAVCADGVSFPLQTFGYDLIGQCRILQGRDSLYVYGELNYSYDNLMSPHVWSLDGRLKCSASQYKRSFFTFVDGNDIYGFIGNQEYSPSITCFRNGNELYSYGSGLDVMADPAAVVLEGNLYFIFVKKRGRRSPCIAVDSAVTEYGFNGFFSSISAW